jgi:eukaryotic-like serine/threonine-protein kinase
MANALAAPARPELVLGRYRPLRPLGSGGSGTVWLARDEASGLDVALKIVAREGRAGERAEREAAAAARLRHKRCLRAYSLAHDERHVYIAYEYVPGRTLREALRAGDVDDARAVEAAAQIAEALAHAHARGVLHRDVKPANVLLADGDEICVRLLDFGLAQIDEAETLTAAGDVPGTLAYVPPERLAGRPAEAAGDVWAVGVLLWEALAGFHPFWRSSPLDAARAIEQGAPPLRSVRPDVPKPLAAAVDRALSTDPARRPTAAKLAASLRGARESAHRRPRVRRPPVPAGVKSLPYARAAAPALAAAGTAWTAATLPFFPAGWWVGLAAVAAATTFVRPRLGLAFALAVPILPLGNVALALALVYAVLAAAWFLLFAREPAGGLLPAAGPLLGAAGALGLAPLGALVLRSPERRAGAVGAAVLLTVAVAGIRGTPLPLTGASPPRDLHLAGSESPSAVGSVLVDALAAHTPLLVAAAALAAAAALLPYATRRGAWGLAAWGSATLAAALLGAPEIAAAPLVLAVWATCAVGVTRSWT